VLGCSLLAAVLAIAVLPWLGGRFLPEFHETSLIGQLHAMPGSSLAETLRLAQRVDAELRPELASHTAVRAGRAELGEDPFPVHRVEMDVVLQPHDRDWETLVQDTAARIARVPGVAFAIEGFLGERIHETLAGDAAPLVVEVLGPDLQRLRGLATEIASVMQRMPGLSRVAVEPLLDVPQVRIEPDRGALAARGVRALDLADTVATYRAGRVLGELLRPSGQLLPVVLVGDAAAQTRAALPDLPIVTLAGTTAPLGTLARIEEGFAPALVNHRDGERRIAIGADSPGSALSRAFEQLQTRLAAFPLPHGYRVEITGEAAARSEAALRLALIGALVLLAVFVLLWAAFSSVTDAAIVLINIPLGLIGGVLGALLGADGVSIAGLVGFVTLFGIVARNGIMVVAHKQHWDLLHPELPARERILAAAEERLLPIVMTAAAAGLGLLPLALSFGVSGSELEAPMAVIVIGGLVSSTLLNALVLPTVYVWLAERREPRKS
jgi:Cu/Ag efflux pump CusA